MSPARIQLTHARGEMSANIPGDYVWVQEQRPELLKLYGPCVILVYQRQVIGRGATVNDAVLDAEQNLPVEVTASVTPFVYHLFDPQRIMSVRLKKQD